MLYISLCKEYRRFDSIFLKKKKKMIDRQQVLRVDAHTDKSKKKRKKKKRKKETKRKEKVTTPFTPIYQKMWKNELVVLTQNLHVTFPSNS